MGEAKVKGSRLHPPVILVTGGNGQVGWELQRTLMSLGSIVITDIDTMDLADPDSIVKAIRQISPDVIINAAAYTDVDQAEHEVDLAMKINGIAPGILAEESKRRKALLIHYSTDYVFDGTKQTAYLESDKPCPLNIYGETKLAGEKAVQDVDGDFLILRTSWVYGLRGKNFLLTMIRLMRERESLRVINDQMGSPTWSRLVAEVTASVLQRALHLRKTALFQSGVYHLTSRGRVSWHGFAKKILELVSQQADEASFKIQKIEAVTAKEYGAVVKRPINSSLSVDKLTSEYHVSFPTWDDALALCMKEMK